MEDSQIKQICLAYNLGEIISPLKPVTGGLLHKMWHLETNKGSYALKLLNPEIMRRPEAFGNYTNSEKIAKEARAAGIPAIVALAVSNQVVFKVNDKFIMIYPWVEGSAVTDKEITPTQARIVGSLLARIHQLNLSLGKSKTQKTNSVKKEYKRLDKEDIDFVEELITKIEQLRTELDLLELNLVVSHRDLDKKNVLWKDENSPVIIDWESAGYVNPGVELMIAGQDWADLKQAHGDLDLFKTVVQSYKESGGKLSASPEVIFYRSSEIALYWLEYNLRRSYEEQFGEEERQIGQEEVVKTISGLRVLNSRKDEIIESFR
ncbi:MAG: phosphotransferase [Candidatus Daviesbacteria bacterium]|nr:phosphotransferase [Candidatus Daviesbacteria bacterium]